MESGAQWKQWIIQGVITVALSTLAAIGGMKAGLATAQAQIVAVQSAQISLAQRLDRIEDKLDRLVERRR
jgi:hypothetical protein